MYIVNFTSYINEHKIFIVIKSKCDHRKMIPWQGGAMCVYTKSNFSTRGMLLLIVKRLIGYHFFSCCMRICSRFWNTNRIISSALYIYLACQHKICRNEKIKWMAVHCAHDVATKLNDMGWLENKQCFSVGYIRLNRFNLNAFFRLMYFI